MVSYVRRAKLDTTDCITEARLLARLTIEECIELCDISPRTWYRWRHEGAPRWAIRLIESQIATLDRFGWQDWEIRNGHLYFNQLHHRYFWTPTKLVLPLYNIDSSDMPWSTWADNLSSLEVARKARSASEAPTNQADTLPPDLSTYAYNIYYVK